MHRPDDLLRILPAEALLPAGIIRILLLLQRGAGGPERVREQFLRPGLFTDRKKRIRVRGLEFLPDQMLAERMNRADFHQIDLFQGRAKIFVLPLLPETVPDFLLHLRSRRVGEGHHQK